MATPWLRLWSVDVGVFLAFLFAVVVVDYVSYSVAFPGIALDYLCCFSFLHKSCSGPEIV